jgi:hypothetical protein
MLELLKLCGFETQDIESELPRVKKTFNRLGITIEDIERGKQRLTKYYDLELKGVRKTLRLILKDVLNLVLAREEGKKIIYGFMAPGFNIIGSTLVSKSKEVHAAYLFESFQPVVGCIFDKMVPVLEAAEKRWLKAGAIAHCANVKTLLGVFALNLIPRPDLLTTSGFLCDTSPKTVNLLHELYDMPTCCYDTCQDRELREYADATKRAGALTGKSIRRLIKRIQEVVGFEITGNMLREVLDAKSKFDHALNQVRILIQSSDPLPISVTHGTLWRALSWLPLNIDGLSDGIDAINTLHEELQERVNNGQGVIEKGAPRILAILPPHMTDPRLEHLMSELGIAIAASDTELYRLTAVKSEDPYEMISLALSSALGESLQKRISFIIEACKRLNVDGVLDRFHAGCRSVVADALIIKESITKELDIPVLVLDWESFDPRVYNHNEYKKRFEVFKTILLNRRANSA